jgi:hypothetical protein
MSSAFVILSRCTIFHEFGYNLELDTIAPNGLEKDTPTKFMALDRHGKPTRIETLHGAAKGGVMDFVNIPLYPYSNPQCARDGVLVASDNLSAALGGNEDAQLRLYLALYRVIVDAVRYQDVEIKHQHLLADLMMGREAYSARLAVLARGEQMPANFLTITRDQATSAVRAALIT